MKHNYLSYYGSLSMLTKWIF